MYVCMYVILNDIGHSEQKRPNLLSKGIALTTEQIVTDGRFFCGLVNGKWSSGVLNRNGFFFLILYVLDEVDKEHLNSN